MAYVSINNARRHIVEGNIDGNEKGHTGQGTVAKLGSFFLRMPASQTRRTHFSRNRRDPVKNSSFQSTFRLFRETVLLNSEPVGQEAFIAAETDLRIFLGSSSFLRWLRTKEEDGQRDAGAVSWESVPSLRPGPVDVASPGGTVGPVWAGSHVAAARQNHGRSDLRPSEPGPNARDGGTADPSSSTTQPHLRISPRPRRRPQAPHQEAQEAQQRQSKVRPRSNFLRCQQQNHHRLRARRGTQSSGAQSGTAAIVSQRFRQHSTALSRSLSREGERKIWWESRSVSSAGNSTAPLFASQSKDDCSSVSFSAFRDTALSLRESSVHRFSKQRESAKAMGNH